MNIAERIRRIRPSSIKATIKVWLYRLIGLNAKADRYLDVYLSRRMYRRVFGREPNLTNPVLFSEKVTARKLFERRPIFTTISDKVLVRDFVAERIGREFLPEVHLVCDRFEDIDFDRLPDEFVIKANHGCRWLSIVEDKKTFDRAATRKQFRRWLRDSYHLYSREHFYKNIKRKLLIEELLKESSGAPVIDYKFFVYDGITRFLLVTKRQSVEGERVLAFFDRNGRQFNVRGIGPHKVRSAVKARMLDDQQKNSAVEITFPANFEQLSRIANELARGFDFLRVDLYNPGGRILFGELTTLPTGGVIGYEPAEFDRILGEHWHLVLNGA